MVLDGVWTRMHHRIVLTAALVVVVSACGSSGVSTEPARSAPKATTLPISSAASPLSMAIGRTTNPLDASSDTASILSSSASPATIAFAAGSESGSATTPQRAGGALANMAIVSDDGEVVVVRDSVMAEPVHGLVTADARTLITTTLHDPAPSQHPSSTTVSWTDLASGTSSASISLDGSLTAIATDQRSRAVALTEHKPGVTGTEIVIAMPTGEVFQRSYQTELLPEGFTNSVAEGRDYPSGMFVIEYLDPPPGPQPHGQGAPRRYHVRVLDTTTGDLDLPLDLRDKAQTVDEQMLGFGRSHVLSQQNGLLFTLYRGIDSDEADYAFVHTLGFVNGVWCLQLPVVLGLATLPGAVVLVDDESKLVVASANGFMTEFVIDDITDPAAEPTPRRTVQAWSLTSMTGPALDARGRTILSGQDGTVRWIDAASLATKATQQWDMQIEAVALSPNGNAVIAGTRRITEITPDGQLVAEIYPSISPFARVVLLGNET